MNKEMTDTEHGCDYGRLWPLIVLFIAGPLGLSGHRARCQVVWSQSFARIEDDVYESDLVEISQRLSVAFGFRVPTPSLAQCLGEWFASFEASLRLNAVPPQRAFTILSQHVDTDATAPASNH